ncbi:hypothetical protein ACP4OV_001353 [Aristida adscensionis]
MASQRSLVLVRLLALCILCGACLAAAKPRYLSARVDELPSSRAARKCPPFKKSVTASGNKLAVPAMCGIPAPPKCCGRGKSARRDFLNRDIHRLSTLLRCPSGSVPTDAPPSTSPVPWIPMAPAPVAVPGIPMVPGTPMAAMPAAPVPGTMPISMAPMFPAPMPISMPPMAAAPSPFVTIPDRAGADLETLEFVVTVGFGTPARPSTLIFDTGSDVSWIQCAPCAAGRCYPQHDPLFDPSKSSSYAAVACDSPQCALGGGKCNGTTCVYSVEYGDDSSTSGVLSRETLTLTASRALPGFVFGCGQSNRGSFGAADGLMGLGRAAASLPSQAAASFGAVFSYCLPSSNDTTGYLTIGSKPVSGNAQFTKMIQKAPYPNFYFVDLVSIDIGGFILPVPPTVFTSTGTLLDSGTIITYLPREAYTALRDRFKFTMKQYKPAPAYDVLDTCYDFTGQPSIIIPAVTLKFSDGGLFDLDFFGIMVFLEQTALGCLAFAARSPAMPFSIIGNTQQRSTEVIYDVAAEKIGFVPASC